MTETTPAQTLFDLTGEVALVTGASSGIGARFAEVLAAQGAKVIAAARRKDRLEALAAKSPNIAALELDVTDAAAIAAKLEEADGIFGPVTLLINNAGVARGGRILDGTPDSWRRIQETNVDAVWNMSQGFARRVVARGGGGNIINIASMVSYVVGASSASYAVSKAAALHMTKAMALEWAKHNIRVNAICPGYIESEMTSDYLATPAGEAMKKRSPQRRAGDVSDLDGALLLLAAPKASGYMTGTSIVVDGGYILS